MSDTPRDDKHYRVRQLYDAMQRQTLPEPMEAWDDTPEVVKDAFAAAIDEAFPCAPSAERPPEDHSSQEIYDYWNKFHRGDGTSEADAHLRALDHLSARAYMRGVNYMTRKLQSHARPSELMTRLQNIARSRRNLKFALSEQASREDLKGDLQMAVRRAKQNLDDDLFALIDADDRDFDLEAALSATGPSVSLSDGLRLAVVIVRELMNENYPNMTRSRQFEDQRWVLTEAVARIEAEIGTAESTPKGA